MNSILHIIERINGGAAASMINLAVGSAQTGAYRHSILSLTVVDSQTSQRLTKLGLVVLSKPNESAMRRAIADADIVQVHFWNTPTLYRWLQKDFPAMRLLLQIQIGGMYAPQVITPAVVNWADEVVTTSPLTARLPVFDGNPPIISYGAADLSRVCGIVPADHTLFTVGYVGTCSFVKMHADFVALCARINVPQARFVVCGDPANGRQLMQQAAVLGIADRVELRGHVQDLRTVFAELDVFGYPLCRDNYGSSDLAIQEAMAAGIPPVLLNYGACPGLIQHNQTGYVVETEEDYCRAVGYLADHPAERRRLGLAARHYAETHLGIDHTVSIFHESYARLLRQAKRERRFHAHLQTSTPADSDPPKGALLFVASLGTAGKMFEASLTGPDDDALQAEADIAAASPTLCNEGGGGIFHYRNAFPDDAWLRLWSGLALSSQGQNVRALHEFKAALDLGLHGWRVYWYMAHVASQLRAWATVQTTLELVLTHVPDFAPALQLAAHIPTNMTDKMDL